MGNTQQSTNQSGHDRIRTRIRTAAFVGWLLRKFSKPDTNRPTKYNAFPKQFNNQLARENGKECINCQLESEKECNECNFKIRGEHSSEIHFANQFNNHFDNKATNPTTIAP